MCVTVAQCSRCCLRVQIKPGLTPSEAVFCFFAPFFFSLFGLFFKTLFFSFGFFFFILTADPPLKQLNFFQC